MGIPIYSQSRRGSAGGSLKSKVRFEKYYTFNENFLVIMVNAHKVLHFITTPNQHFVHTIPYRVM